MLTAPITEMINPIAAEVPIAFLIEYPNIRIKGTDNEPPPIPKGTEINPIKVPMPLLI